MAKFASSFNRNGVVTMCVNCGQESTEVTMLRCRMVERCITSQNGEIIGASKDDDLIEAIRSGRKPLAEEGRPLCAPCCTKSNFTCYVCELEAASERRL
jgi:hypothetical protein